MVTLENDMLVLDRSQNGDDILPLLHPGTGGRAGAWYIDIGIERDEVLHRLLDAEILDEPLRIRYIARNGQRFEAQVQIEELISDEEGHRCRLRGAGLPPPALLGDAPDIPA